MRITNQIKLIYFMRSGHVYHLSKLEKSGIKGIRAIASEAVKKGLLVRYDLGRYRLSAAGIQLARTYVEPRGHSVIREHLYDTPPIAWPV